MSDAPLYHVFDAATSRTCQVCGMTGLRRRSSWPSWLDYCPGVQWYRWEDMPAGLATKTTLEREGLRATGEPVACYAAFSRKTYVYLYDRAQASPKRTLSEKQQAALATSTQALQASRTCARCRRRVQSKRKLVDAGEAGRLCGDCYEEWERKQEQLQLYQWAAQMLADAAETERTGEGKPVRILDTETTGLDADAEVIEVAIVDLAGQTLVHSLVRPQQPIPLDATMIHGLTDADVASAPALPDVWPQIGEALRGALVLAYNAPFDRGMLAQSAERYGLQLPKARWECLMEACTVFSDDGERWLSLETVCWELGVATGGHRALDDALAALDVVRALAARARELQPVGVAQRDGGEQA